MHGISVHEESYAILYTWCAHRFPNVAQCLPKPVRAQHMPTPLPSPQLTSGPDPLFQIFAIERNLFLPCLLLPLLLFLPPPLPLLLFLLFLPAAASSVATPTDPSGSVSTATASPNSATACTPARTTPQYRY